MARLVYLTNGLTGGLNVGIEIAHRLRNAGHEIAFVGHRDLAGRINTEGFEYTRLVADDQALAELSRSLQRIGSVRSVPDAWRLRQKLISSTEIDTAVRAAKPDGLLIDVEAHYAILATRPLGLPTIIKADWFSINRRRSVPPLHSGLGLATTPAERRAVQATWAKALGQRLAQNTVGQLHPRRLARRIAPFRYDTIARSDLRPVARARGLQLRSITTQTNWLYPHTYNDLPLMTSTASELDFGVDPGLHYVGPLVQHDRTEPSVTTVERDQWDDFKKQNAASGKPLVYCSFGSMFDAKPTSIDTVMAMAQARPDWDLVVGWGGQVPSQPTPANVLELHYAPQTSVLEAADVAIGHGGINSINECVTYGVPMLLDPLGRDQPGCAARVEHHGIGVRASLNELSVSELERHVEYLLNDGGTSRRMSAMQQAFARYRTDQVLESVIERLFSDHLGPT